MQRRRRSAVLQPHARTHIDGACKVLPNSMRWPNSRVSAPYRANNKRRTQRFRYSNGKCFLWLRCYCCCRWLSIRSSKLGPLQLIVGAMVAKFNFPTLTPGPQAKRFTVTKSSSRRLCGGCAAHSAKRAIQPPAGCSRSQNPRDRTVLVASTDLVNFSPPVPWPFLVNRQGTRWRQRITRQPEGPYLRRRIRGSASPLSVCTRLHIGGMICSGVNAVPQWCVLLHTGPLVWTKCESRCEFPFARTREQCDRREQLVFFLEGKLSIPV